MVYSEAHCSDLHPSENTKVQLTGRISSGNMILMQISFECQRHIHLGHVNLGYEPIFDDESLDRIRCILHFLGSCYSNKKTSSKSYMFLKI